MEVSREDFQEEAIRVTLDSHHFQVKVLYRVLALVQAQVAQVALEAKAHLPARLQASFRLNRAAARASLFKP